MVRRFQHPVFALQYDLSEGDRSRLGDREWYAERLADCRGPILELGAGTGRITLPLARRGHDLIAVDVGRPMLQRLAGKLLEQDAAPTRPGAVRPVCADMRRLPLRDRTAAAALSAYNSLGCLLKAEDLTRTYGEIHRLLRLGAPFLFDVPVPGPTEPYLEAAPPRHEEWGLPGGGVIERTATVRPPPAEGRLRLEYAFRWRDASGAAGEETVRFELNTWPPAFYAELAEAAGFAVAHREEPTFRDRRGRERAWAFFELQRR